MVMYIFLNAVKMAQEPHFCEKSAEMALKGTEIYRQGRSDTHRAEVERNDDRGSHKGTGVSRRNNGVGQVRGI